jgi:hypothetical protein
MNAPIESGPSRAYGAALAITIAALLLLAIFQTVDVVRDHFVLSQQIAAQQAAVDQTQKLHAQLTALAGKTAELARAGDVGARNVAKYMQREGVTLRPPTASSSK